MLALSVTVGNDDVVSETTAERIAAADAASTRRAYARLWAEFTDWCADHGRTALPASDATLAEYVSHLADRGLA